MKTAHKILVLGTVAEKDVESSHVNGAHIRRLSLTLNGGLQFLIEDDLDGFVEERSTRLGSIALEGLWDIVFAEADVVDRTRLGQAGREILRYAKCGVAFSRLVLVAPTKPDPNLGSP